VSGEKEADMKQILTIFRKELDRFNRQTGRKISLEVEPGSWLVGHSGLLLSRIVDIVDTVKGI